MPYIRFLNIRLNAKIFVIEQLNFKKTVIVLTKKLYFYRSFRSYNNTIFDPAP